jgi:hypothetical protein
MTAGALVQPDAGSGGRLPWRHRVASSVTSAQGAIRPVPFGEAQEWCNFAVLRPTALPPDLRVHVATLRPEAPPGRPPGLDMTGRFRHGRSNRASYRIELCGGGRALRVKQFHYDLGPPAFDHPSMWLRPARPFVCGERVGWLGEDFAGRPAASFGYARTMVEVAVTSGSFSDQEIATVVEGLRPARPDAAASILGTPMADLYYQRRHEDLVITVPMGYWQHRRRPATLRTHVLRAAEVPDALREMEVPPPAEQFRLDSALWFAGPEGRDEPGEPREIEWIYVDRRRPERCVRILTWRAGREGSAPYPPRRDRQPCSSQVLNVRRRRVFHAFRDRRYGQHDAMWRQHGLVVMMLAKPDTSTDDGWFRWLLEGTVNGR